MMFWLQHKSIHIFPRCIATVGSSLDAKVLKRSLVMRFTLSAPYLQSGPLDRCYSDSNGSSRNAHGRAETSVVWSGVASVQGDEVLIRRAIALSEESILKGGRPFGAVIINGAGDIVAEAHAVASVDPRDWTAHSEMQALRKASAILTWDELSRATIYASSEPCPMCAAAIYWCNIRRLVYSVSEPAVRALRAPYQRAAGIAIRCEEIFDRCERRVEIVGPLMEEEGLSVHRRFWQNASAAV
jgi:tRNA(Arg) A34 adenosine deaminase TadA